MECREIVDQVKRDTIVCQECNELQLEFAKNPGGLPPRRGGLIIACVVGGAALGITSVCVPFVLPALRKVCLPYVPATPAQLRNVRTALQGRNSSHPQPRLLDIGLVVLVSRGTCSY